jgi:hypothetical protein
MTPTEHPPKAPHSTGLFAVLAGLLHGTGTAAPASARGRIGSLGREGWSGLCVAGLLLTLAFGVTPALANTFEGFRPPAIGEGKGSEAGQLELAAPFGLYTGQGGERSVAGSGVAVNDKTHDVYVADTGNHRVDEFESDGKFVRTFGKEVNKTKVDTPGATEAEKNVCSGGLEECQKGAVGKVPGELPGELAQPRFIAVDNAPGPSDGDVYVGDGVGREEVNEQQLVKLDGATGGTFTLSFEGHTTSPIPYSPHEGSDRANTVSALEAAMGEHGVFNVIEKTNESEGRRVSLFVEFVGALKETTTGVLGCGGAGLTPAGGKCETLVADQGTPSVVEGITKFSENGKLEEGWGEKGRLTGSGAYALSGQFSGLAVNSAGDVLAAAGPDGKEIYEFEPNGAFGPGTEPVKLQAFLHASGIAVNSAGDLYVVIGNDKEGSAVEFSPTGQGLGKVSAEHEPDATGLALNAATGALYLGLGDEIEQASPLLTFGSPPLQGSAGVAVDSSTGEPPFSGAVYAANTVEDVVDVNTVQIAAESAPASEVTATSMTLHGEVNPEGSEVTSCYFEYGTSTAYEDTVPCAQDTGAIGEGTSFVPVSVKITGLRGGTVYHFRVVVRKGGAVAEGSDVQAPATSTVAVLSGEEAVEESASSWELQASVDPEGLAIETCTFEYGTGQGTYGTSVPCKPGVSQIGAGSAVVPVSVRLNGLEANVTYHWRLSVRDADGTSSGPDHTFVYSTSTSELPDDRAYEMVTPPFKNGASIEAIFTGPRLDIAEDGERVIADSIQCFAGSQSCTVDRSGKQGEPFEFNRTASGWVTSALAPPSSVFSENTARALSANEGMALFTMPTPPDGEDDWYKRETNGTFTDIGPAGPPAEGQKAGLAKFEPLYATADFSHLVVNELEPVWPFAAAPGDQVLEWVGVGDHGPFLVGVNSEGKSVDGCETTLGGIGRHAGFYPVSADGRTVYFTACPRTAQAQLYARVDGEEPEVEGRRLKPETVAISAPQCGEGTASDEVACREAPASAASFVGASEDGSSAFFLDTQQLTDEATRGTGTAGISATAQGEGCSKSGNDCNLYESQCTEHCQEAGEKRALIDVSAATRGENPEVLGVEAVSREANSEHVYFVANGVLAPGASRGHCNGGQGGSCNLYVYERGERYPNGHVQLIARVPSADYENWKGGEDLANVTPDGRFLVFESRGDLTSDDSRSDGYTQVFRYDADPSAEEAEHHVPQLVRVSIGQDGYDDDGNGGVGETTIAAPYGPIGENAYPERDDPTMSDNGSYVFFQSPIGLTAHALDDVVIGYYEIETLEIPVYAENVYEWEADAVGACDAVGGCVSLISDGRDVSEKPTAPCPEAYETGEDAEGYPEPQESATCLLGTDASGRNVFFQTADQLVRKDTDTQIDIYDARICEADSPCISEPPPPSEPCDGENCHGIPEATPSLITPGSASFNGQGNTAPAPVKPAVKPKAKVVKCKKNYVKNKKGLCTRKKKTKKSKKASKSNRRAK